MRWGALGLKCEGPKAYLREGCYWRGRTGEAEGRGNWGRESWGSATVVGQVCGPCLLPPPPRLGSPVPDGRLTAPAPCPAELLCPGLTGERRGAGAELLDWFARPGPTPPSPGMPAQCWCSCSRGLGGCPCTAPEVRGGNGGHAAAQVGPPRGAVGASRGAPVLREGRNRGKMQSQVQMPVFPGPAV